MSDALLHVRDGEGCAACGQGERGKSSWQAASHSLLRALCRLADVEEVLCVDLRGDQGTLPHPSICLSVKFAMMDVTN